MYTCFACKFVCTTYTHRVPEKCAGSPEIGAVDGCQPPGGSWELNPVLVTTEPTRAPSFIVLKGKIYSDFFKLMSTCFHLQSKFCCVCEDNSAVFTASCSGHTKQYSTHSWQSAVSLLAGISVLLGHSHIPFAEFRTSLPQQGVTPPGHILFPFFLASIEMSTKFSLPLSAFCNKCLG